MIGDPDFPMNDIDVNIIRTETKFLALRDVWNELAADSEYPNIFTSFDWQRLWWDWFGKKSLHGELFVLTVRKGNELLGIVPFYRRRRNPLLCMGKHLHLMGYGGKTCPEYLGPLVRKGNVDVVAEATVEFLKQNPSEWDSMFLEDYALDDPGTVALANRLRGAFAEHGGPGEGRLIVPLTDDFEDYMKTLGPSTRKQRRKRFNQAITRHGARIDYPDEKALDAAFPILVDLTTKTRERRGEANPFHDPIYAGFHRELLACLLPQHKALLGILYLDERPAAIGYCFLLGNKCYAYQSGFSTEFEGSPSDVCQQFIMRRLTTEHVTEFDHLRGLESYKESIAKDLRQTRWTFFFRKRGLGFFLRLLLDKIARPLVRRLRAWKNSPSTPKPQETPDETEAKNEPTACREPAE